MQQTVSLSAEQTAAFAALLLPDAIRAYCEQNKAEFEEWRAKRQREQVEGGINLERSTNALLR